MYPEDPGGEVNHQEYLLANILHFGRTLRRFGIPVASQQIAGFSEGVSHINISQRDDFYNTARAFFLHDVQILEVFNLVFDVYWSQQINANLEPIIEQTNLYKKILPRQKDSDGYNPVSKDAPNKLDSLDKNPETIENESDIFPFFSPIELLHRKDFSEYNESELLQAREIIRGMGWKFGQKRSCRKVRASRQTDNLDFRRTIRNHTNSGEELLKLEWHRRKLKPRPLVVICDISGSMERYSQLFLYFIYGMVQSSRRIESFVFGTRLTRLTHALRNRGTDKVFPELSDLIFDWSSGTRIGESLKDFNFRWSRRVLGHGAVVIIISDGWDRGDLKLLEVEIGRLSRFADRLIWVNPLSGSNEYEPLVGGMKTVLPFIDEFLPLHNLINLYTVANKILSLS
jgi:uncharacterized protein with von Willebrand factor type A (vWA) domain